MRTCPRRLRSRRLAPLEHHARRRSHRELESARVPPRHRQGEEPPARHHSAACGGRRSECPQWRRRLAVAAVREHRDLDTAALLVAAWQRAPPQRSTSAAGCADTPRSGSRLRGSTSRCSRCCCAPAPIRRRATRTSEPRANGSRRATAPMPLRGWRRAASSGKRIAQLHVPRGGGGTQTQPPASARLGW